MVNALLIICNKIWRTGEWPTPWTQSLVIALPKKGNLQLCQKYRTIILISHPSKVMLKIILNRLKPEAEKKITEEQAGVGPGRSTTEQIFNFALEDHKPTVSIGGRIISNLRFADNIHGLAGAELELASPVEHLDQTSTAYRMQISAEKTKLMTININGISSKIGVNGEMLETVQSFKYLGAIVTDEGFMPKMHSRIAKTIAALTKLKIIWDDRNIDLGSKIRLLRFLVMSIFYMLVRLGH